MTGRGSEWMRVPVACLALVAALSATSVLAESPRADDAPDQTAQPTAKLIALKFRDPQCLIEVLRPLPAQISPDPQTSRLLVIARPDEIKQVEDLVRELDVPIERTKDQPQLELKLYRLKYRQPHDLVECVAPMLSERGRISADAGSRTLLVKDEPTIHTDIALIIREIDAPLADPAVASTNTGAIVLPPIGKGVGDVK